MVITWTRHDDRDATYLYGRGRGYTFDTFCGAGCVSRLEQLTGGRYVLTAKAGAISRAIEGQAPDARLRRIARSRCQR